MLYSTIRAIHKQVINKQRVLLLFCILFTQLVQAQMPVQISTQVIAPYSLKLSDYYNGTMPKLIVTATNQDLSKPVLEVRLRMTITGDGNGVKIISRDNVYYPTIYLDAGIPVRLTLSDFTAYFNADNLLFQGGITREKYLQGGKLPEGFYTISFDAIEVNSKQVVSSPSAARFWASLSDPPLLNQPIRDGVEMEKNPTNIVFNWTPRHLNSPNSAFNTEYVFQLVEINDPRINPLSAFETASPLFEEVTRSTSLVYGPAQPLLLKGRRYAWRVRAREVIGSDDVDVFKNNGFSEVYWFSYGVQCGAVPPANIQTSLKNGELMITWDAAANTTNYLFKYRLGTTLLGPEKIENISGTQRRISLSPGTKIEYSIGSSCYWGGQTNYSLPQTFSVPGSNEVTGRIYWAYRKSEEPRNEPAVSLLSTTATNREQYGPIASSDDKPGSQSAFTLEGATVQLHAKDKRTGQAIWVGQYTAETNKNGDYRILLPVSFKVDDYKDYYLAITSSKNGFDEGLMTYLKWPVKTMVNSTYGYQMGNDTLSAQTTRFVPSINCASCANAQDASVDVLMKEQEWYKYQKYYEAAGLGTNPLNNNRRDIVKYNGEDYLVIAKLTSGQSYNKLFNNRSNAERYVVRVNYKGTTPVFYPLRSFAYPLSKKELFAPIMSLSRSFELKLNPRVEGFVTYKKQPRRDVAIKVFLSKPNATLQVFSATTDAAGYYRINLPLLNDAEAAASTVTIRANDYSVNNFKDEIKKYSEVIKQDFAFTAAPVFLLVGRIADQYGQPVRNALVAIDGTSITTRTSAEGFYGIKTHIQTVNTIRVVADGYNPLTFTYTPRKIDPNAGDEQYTAELWASRIERLVLVQNYLRANQLSAASADLLGMGSGSLQALYPTYMRPTESLKDMASLDTRQMNNQQGALDISVQLDGTPVKAKMKITSGAEHSLKGTDIIRFPNGSYTYQVSSSDATQPFLPTQGEFRISGGTLTKIALKVYRGINVNGVVVDKKTGNPLANADLTAKGLPYATKTDAQGNFTLLLPANREIGLTVERERYNPIDTGITFTTTATLRLRMEAFSGEMPQITAIAGYPVTLDKIVPASSGSYVVSGKMEVGENDIFAPDAASNKLTFKNLSVKLDAETQKYTPLADILFEEAVMKTTAFGFAPVEVLGYPSIKLTSLKNSKGDYTYENGTIGGLQLKLLMSTAKNVSRIPIRIHDALLELDDSSVIQQTQARLDTARKKFAYVYTPPGYKINALGPDKEFTIHFLASDTGRTGIKLKKDSGDIDADYYKAAIGWVSAFYIRKDSAILNKDGINLNGYVQFPKVAALKISDSGKVVIEKFLIGKDFTLQQLTFRVSERRPLTARLQKIEARLTKFSVFGLGTPNVGVGVGGIILLKKDSAAATGTTTATGTPTNTASPTLGGATSSTNRNTASTTNTAAGTSASKGRNDTLFIHEFNFVNKEDGITVDGKLAFGQRGIGLKSLVFSNPVGTYIGLSYNFTEKSFIIDGSGLLRYDRNRNGNGKTPASTAGKDTAVNSIFPIEIQKFEYKSKDGSFLMAAKANISVGFKVFKLKVERLVVSVGSDASLDQMNSYLVSGTAQGSSIGTGGPDEPLDESKCSWAIGVSGGLEFAYKGFPSSLKGSILVGNLNDQIQVRVNEIALEIKQSSFEISAGVKISLEPEKWGFEGQGTFTSLAKQLTASAAFHFYKLPGGIDLGAEVKVSTAIITGPIMWHALGGGFRLNTADNIYSVKLLGDVGPAGTPKTTGYVKDAYVEVLFDANNCGAKPVIKMGGKLNLMEKDMAQVTGTFDFCRTLMLITLKTEPIPIPGVPGITAKLDGTLFGLAQTDAKMLILNVNADFSSMGADLLKGNLGFALGFNYDNNHPYAPQEIKNFWNNIEYGAKDNNGTVLNGVAVSGNVSIPGKSGGFNVSLAGLSIASASYSFGGSGNMKLYYKFTDKTFKFAAGISAYVQGDISVLGVGFGGRGDASLYLEGGYGSKSEEEMEDKLKVMEAEMVKRLANPQPLDFIQSGNGGSLNNHGYKQKENSSFLTGDAYGTNYREFRVPTVSIDGQNVPIDEAATKTDTRLNASNNQWYSYIMDTKKKKKVYLQVWMFTGEQYNYNLYAGNYLLKKVEVKKQYNGGQFHEFYEVPTNAVGGDGKVVIKVAKNDYNRNPIWIMRLRVNNNDGAEQTDGLALGLASEETKHSFQYSGDKDKEIVQGEFDNGKNKYRYFSVPSFKIDNVNVPISEVKQKVNDLTNNYDWYSYKLDTKKQPGTLYLNLLESNSYNFRIYLNGTFRTEVKRGALSANAVWDKYKYQLQPGDIGPDGKVEVKIERGSGKFEKSQIFDVGILPNPEVWKQQEQQRINQEMAQRVASDQRKAWYLKGKAAMNVQIYNNRNEDCNDYDLLCSWKICLGFSASFSWRQGDGTTINVSR